MMRWYISVVLGLIINTSFSNPSTVPTDLDQYPTVKTIYVPLIPDIRYEEAILKLKQLWVRQYDHFRTFKKCAEDIKNITGGRPMQQIGWVLNDTEERLEEQIDVLSTLPWEFTSARMKEALDSDLIFQHKKSLEGMEKCLNDHYAYRETDDQEALFRKTLKTARQDLLQGEEEIKRLVISEEIKTTTPITGQPFV